MNRGLIFFINSAVTFASAELITAALHETGHGLAAQALGFAPRIYAFYENNPNGNPTQSLIILAAGPLMSLVTGLIFWLWYRKTTPGYNIGRLLLCWLAWLGIAEFVNYIIVTPWLTIGDTAVIANLLGLPIWSRYLVALLGLCLLFALARTAAQDFLLLAPSQEILQTPYGRRRFIMRGFYLALIAGTVLTALAGIGGNPTIIAVGLLGTLGNLGIVGVAIAASGAVSVYPQLVSNTELRIDSRAVGIYLLLVVFYVLALRPGLPV